MSRVLLVCQRYHTQTPIDSSEIHRLAARIVPDNIRPNPPIFYNQDGLMIGVINPTSPMYLKKTSAYVGYLDQSEPKWWEPLSKFPDGAYALFRSNNDIVELVTDVVASRTIWYIQTEHLFIASTSQRAIIFFLKSYEPSESAIVWMLSSGCLGAGNSWDRRINCVRPGTNLILNRQSWKLTVKENDTQFQCEGKTGQQYEKTLREVLDKNFSNLDLNYSKCAISLSGGYDSREILLKLKDKKLQCITWGHSSAITDEGNDAFIANQLAIYFGMPHKYFALEQNGCPIEKCLDMFISAGEARTDNIAGYIDGFQVWKWLFESGFQNILRGDESFGWPPQYNLALGSSQCRQAVGMRLFSDLGNMNIIEKLIIRQFNRQQLPDLITRKKGESFSVWRDRIYQQFRIPVCLAALNEIKCAYVEVVTPFLSRSIIEIMRTVPDALRNNKSLFRMIVNSESPDIPYATRNAISELPSITRVEETTNLIADTLNSHSFRVLFSNNLIDRVLDNIKIESNALLIDKPSLRISTNKLIPSRLKSLIRLTFFKRNLDFHLLAFRMFLAGKAINLFYEDADGSIMQVGKGS